MKEIHDNMRLALEVEKKNPSFEVVDENNNKKPTHNRTTYLDYTILIIVILKKVDIQ